MLRSTFYSFTTSLRGMNAAQKALDVTGHNISNAKTPGYTRQRADIYSAVAGGYGDRYATRMSTMAGQGAIVDSISQIRDQFLDVRFRKETAVGSEESAKLAVMDDMEKFFNEIEKSGLQDSFNTFVSRLQQLSRNVESPEFDNLARDAAQSLAMQLNHYARQLKSVREGQEYNLREVDVPEINNTLKKIADLNKSIREVQANGAPALELKDERNLLLDKLAAQVDIDVRYKPNYMAGDIMVEDVTVSLIGKKADGTYIKRPVIYNDAAANLDVETPSADGTKKSYVKIDASQLPAREMQIRLDGYLRAMANANKGVMYIKGEMSANYDKYKEFMDTPARVPLTAELGGNVQTILNSIFDKANFAKPIADMTAEEFSDLLGTETIDKINEALDEVPGGVMEKLKQVVQAHSDASKEYNRLLDDRTATPQQIQTARENFAKAAKAEADWQTYTVGLINIREELNHYKTNLDDAKKQIKNADQSIKDTLAAEDIDAELTRTGGDYGTGKYTFKRAGNPILDKGGVNPVTWNVGNAYKELERKDLEDDLGIDFVKISKKLFGDEFKTEFDFEELECKGALRGNLKMLNESGVFDNGATADTVRGTGFYEKLLDTLADKLATTLNNLNDRKSTTNVKETLFQIDPSSKVQDRFTAENIRISKDWLEGKYRLTASQEVQPERNPARASARNENLLLMISTITQRIGYDTGVRMEKNKYDLYVDANGNAVADSIDAEGNYVKTVEFDTDPAPATSMSRRKVPETKLAAPVKVANRDGIKYKPDGTLDVLPNQKIDFTANTKLQPTVPQPVDGPTWEVGGVKKADGRDAQGNYTLRTDGTNTWDPPKWVADASGIIEYKDGTGAVIANHKDDDGNYVMRTVDARGKITDKLVANKDGIVYELDANGNLKKDVNGMYVPQGNKIYPDATKAKWQKSFVYNGSFKEYLTNLGNTLALDINSTKGLADNSKTVVNDVQDQRDSVSKVNLDEEGVNILLYQKAYNASARMMTALDEAIDKIINGMGVVGR